MATPEWRFRLCNTSDLSVIDEITKGRSRHVDLTLNRPNGITMNLSLEDPVAPKVVEHKTCIKAIRNGVTIVSAPVYKCREDANANQLQITCTSWLEELAHRIIRKIASGGSMGWAVNQEQNWLNAPVNTIIFDLLARANEQKDGVLGDQTLRPTKIVQGTSNLTDPTNFPTWPVFNYQSQRGQNIWALMQALSDIENGIDIFVDQDSRAMNLYYPRFGITRPEVVFGYNWGPGNLANIVRNRDGTKTMNRMTVRDRTGAAAFAEDTASMNTWGVMFEEDTQIDALDTSIALGYAGAEVAIRAQPLVTHEITMFPANSTGKNIPRFKDDFNLGDTVYFSCRKGYIVIDKQAVRVFGIGLDIDDEGNEKLSSVSTSPSS